MPCRLPVARRRCRTSRCPLPSGHTNLRSRSCMLHLLTKVHRQQHRPRSVLRLRGLP
jgi:hypothetical protein